MQPSRQLGGQGLPLLTHSTTDSLVQEEDGGRWLEGTAGLAAQQVKAHTTSRSHPCPGFSLPAQMVITAIVRAGVPVFQSLLPGAPPDHPPPSFSAVAGVIRTRLCCTHHSHLRVLSRHSASVSNQTLGPYPTPLYQTVLYVLTSPPSSIFFPTKSTFQMT